MMLWRNQQKEAFSGLRKHNNSTNHFYRVESVFIKQYERCQKKAGPNISHGNERMQEVK